MVGTPLIGLEGGGGKCHGCVRPFHPRVCFFFQDLKTAFKHFFCILFIGKKKNRGSAAVVNPKLRWKSMSGRGWGLAGGLWSGRQGAPTCPFFITRVLLGAEKKKKKIRGEMFSPQTGGWGGGGGGRFGPRNQTNRRDHRGKGNFGKQLPNFSLGTNGISLMGGPLGSRILFDF